MPRLILLAIALSALLWTGAVRAGSVFPADITTMSPIGATLVTGDSHDPRDSDQYWRAQHHTIAAVSESVWKSAPVHAALAAARLARGFETVRLVTSSDPPFRSAPHYLRHTPLLI